jgi:hypothetical protein
MAAHRGGADRLRFRDSPVPRTFGGDTRSPRRLSSTRAAVSGLALISCGILALLVSIWQYWWGIRYLWGEPFAPIAGVTKEGKQTPVIAVAIVLIGIGLFAFFAVLLRLT